MPCITIVQLQCDILYEQCDKQHKSVRACVRPNPGNVDLNSKLKSSNPSAAYMCQWIGSASVQIMAFRLFGAKPLSKPMLVYCQLDFQEQTSVKI